MKKLIAFILFSAFSVQAQLLLIDTNTPHSIGGGGTIYGDPLKTAATKLNYDLQWLLNYATTNHWDSTNLMGKLLSLSNTVVALNTAVTNIENTITNFPGTNILDLTVNSNKFDADTLAWLQTLFYAGVAMNFDSGAITSDGSGNITANSIKAGLLDSGSSSGTSGYTPVANGSGGWSWTELIYTRGGGGTATPIKSPDGTTWYLIVDNSGNVSATTTP